MFCTKRDNAKINKIHKRTLRTIYHDYTSSFSELLHKSKGVPIQTKNLQLLMTEVYKFINGLGPSYMSDIFNLATEKYNLRCKHRLTIRKVQSVKHGYQTISFRAAIIWNNLPNKYKEKTLSSFKSAIKQYPGQNCHCRICL